MKKTILLLLLLIFCGGCAAINPAHRDPDFSQTYERWNRTTLYWHTGASGF